MSFLQCKKRNELQKIVTASGVSVLGNVIVVKISDESLESVKEQLLYLGIDNFFAVVDTLQDAIEVAAKCTGFSTILRSTCSFKINYAIWAVHLQERLKSSPQEVIAHGAVVKRGMAKGNSSIPKIRLADRQEVTDIPAFSLTPAVASMIKNYKDAEIMERVSATNGIYLVMYGEQYAIDKDCLDSGNMLSSRIKIDDFPYAKFAKSTSKKLTAIVYVTCETEPSLKKTIKCLQDNDIKTIIVTENVKIDLCDYSTHGNFLVKIQMIENRREMGECYSLFSAATNVAGDENVMFMYSGEVFERSSIEFILGLCSDKKVIHGPAKKEFKSFVVPARYLKGLHEVVFDRVTKTWKRDLDWNLLKNFFENQKAVMQQSTIVNLHL